MFERFLIAKFLLVVADHCGPKMLGRAEERLMIFKVGIDDMGWK